MPTKKVTDLTADTTPKTTDVYHVVDTTDTTQGPAGSSYKITWATLKAAILAFFTAGTGITFSGGLISSDPTATQTLTNKTLTSPVINSPTISTPTTTGAFTNNGSYSGTAVMPITLGGTGQTTSSAAINALLPSQSSNAGKALVTDGTNPSWVSASLPSQTGNASKFLTTDGTSASWAATFLGKYAAGSTTRDTTLASGTQTIAHGLGVTPASYRVIGLGPGGQMGVTLSNNSVGQTSGNASDNPLGGTNTFVIYSTSSASYIATFAADATNITITWTKTGSPTGTAFLIWEALA